MIAICDACFEDNERSLDGLEEDALAKYVVKMEVTEVETPGDLMTATSTKWATVHLCAQHYADAGMNRYQWNQAVPSILAERQFVP